MSALRLSTEADLPQIMDIIHAAQAYLAAQGIDQWQDGYPNEDVTRQDIALGQGYVLAEEGRVQGIATITFDGEPSYAEIHDGAWTTPEPYGCMHRIAVDATLRGKGIADALMQAGEEVVRARGLHGIRIDTHRENLVMQGMLRRNGFVACGVIYLQGGKEHGAKRIAFEKRL